MPIVNIKPTEPSPVVSNIPKVESKPAESIIVDTKYEPRSSLLKYLEGPRWTVNYFSQVLNKDSALYGQDPSQDPIYQQYKKINHINLYVEDDLSQSQNEATKLFSVRGSANIPLSIIPNRGDMFEADVGDGRRGVFEVTNSTKKTIFRDSSYLIEYHLVYHVDQQESKYADLTRKVVSEYYYVEEFHKYNQNPILTTPEYDTFKNLFKQYWLVKQQYMRWFFSRDFMTVLVPRQATSVYDPFLVKALGRLFHTKDHPEFLRMRTMNVEDDMYFREFSLWEALMHRDGSVLNSCFKRAGLISTKEFNYDPMTENIRYSGIAECVYPITIQTNAFEGISTMPQKVVFGKLSAGLQPGGNSTILLQDNEISIAGKLMTLVHPVTQDDHYILSQAFYDNKGGEMSLLEVMCRDYIEKEAINPAHIATMLTNCWKWPELERFYYVPLLLILANNIIKEK